MKLEKFKVTHKGRQAKYVSDLADVKGNKHFRISIRGPGNLIKKVFAESDFDIKIDPKGTERDFKKERAIFWKSHSKKFSKSLKPEEGLLDIFKKKRIRKPTKNNSIIVSLEKIGGKGTYWRYQQSLFLPKGVDAFFIFPQVNFTHGVIIPSSGDPDLYLYSNDSYKSSSLNSSGLDSVYYDSFFKENVVIRANGYKEGHCFFFGQGIGISPF